MVKVIPAILTASLGELGVLLTRCEGIVDRVQIDIIDGNYADNKTIDPVVFESIDTDLNLDFHLMVKEPRNWVERCARAGADRIIGQVEMMKSQKGFIEKVQSAGAYIGFGIDLKTSVDSIDKSLINSLDSVLVMSVPAGRGGQEFDARALKKIRELDEIRSRDTTPFNIVDDGGITLDSVDDARRAGADEVVIGRRLFDGDLKVNIERYIKASYAR